MAPMSQALDVGLGLLSVLPPGSALSGMLRYENGIGVDYYTYVAAMAPVGGCSGGGSLAELLIGEAFQHLEQRVSAQGLCTQQHGHAMGISWAGRASAGPRDPPRPCFGSAKSPQPLHCFCHEEFEARHALDSPVTLTSGSANFSTM